MRQRGLTLIEVAMIMAILGLLMAAVLAGYRVYVQARAQEITQKHMQAVEDAVGTYITRFQRYPVPMAFRVAEGDAGYGRAGTLAGPCGASPPADARVCRGAGQGGNVLVGSVPFQDLNMPADMILDGYGRRFTYAVSEQMTQAGGNTPALHRICMKKQTVDSATGDVVMQDCGTADNPVQDVAIVSHGREGTGAWSAQGQPYLSCAAVSGQAQGENCNNDGVFIQPVVRFSANNAHFNDDVVSADVTGDSNYWDKLLEGVRSKGELYIGIGIDQPGRALDVAGNLKADKLRSPNLCKRDAAGNEVDCFDPALIAGDTGMRCGVAAYATGVAYGAVTCAPLIKTFTCPAGEILAGVTAAGEPYCINPAVPPTVPPSTPPPVEPPATPVNGSCGGAANTCGAGTAGAYHPGTCGGTATWTCTGANGGSTASCSVPNAACGINGACGATAGTCSAGTVTGLNPGACGTMATWTCAGTGGGSSASCSVPNAACVTGTWKEVKEEGCPNFEEYVVNYGIGNICGRGYPSPFVECEGVGTALPGGGMGSNWNQSGKACADIGATCVRYWKYGRNTYECRL